MNYPLYAAGKWLQSEPCLSVLNKYSSEPLHNVALANESIAEAAVQSCLQAERLMRKMPAWRRAGILTKLVKLIEADREDLRELLMLESGKVYRDAEAEIDRFLATFSIAAEEALRLGGDFQKFERNEATQSFYSTSERVAVGLSLFITPFNFPLNLLAHKIAPAIAAGSPFILKPSDFTPRCALRLGELLLEAGMPAEAFAILPCGVEVAEKLVRDERIKLLSFTGSGQIGWYLKSIAGKKKVLLELGGNAACVVHSDADLAEAVQACVRAAFYQSGQSCISLQRLYVHEDLYEEFSAEFLEQAQSLLCGDPCQEEIFIGPLINNVSCERVLAWISEAEAQGADVLLRPKRDGNILSPAVLTRVPESCDLVQEEAFAPVLVLESYEAEDEVIARVNDSRFGLQAGIFTDSVRLAQKFADEVDCAAVIIGAVPAFRADEMPYGGIKDSGLGREGLSSAIEEMTELKLKIWKKS